MRDFMCTKIGRMGKVPLKKKFSRKTIRFILIRYMAMTYLPRSGGMSKKKGTLVVGRIG
jgi:hypothetical protein